MRLIDDSAPGGDYQDVECARCGDFRITRTAEAQLSPRVQKDPWTRATLSHAVRRMQRTGSRPFINTKLAEELTSSLQLPSPPEQVESLLLWLGDELASPGREVTVDPKPLTAIIGALDESGFNFIVNELVSQDLLTMRHVAGFGKAQLTFAGWQKYQDLKRSYSESRKGFMAMAFSNETLRRIFVEHFKPASQAAGFNLVRIDDAPPAGLIDVRLQNEIRTSRFLVADLTDHNPGAYWEAGFAHGLGLPVIYTCEDKMFKDPGTHFDTNHFHTIRWNAENPAEAANRLRDTIRATLPQDAKLDDA